MHRRTSLALLAALALPLAACGSDAAPAGEAKPTGDMAVCADPDITEEDYNRICLDGATPEQAAPMKLGQSADTAASGGNGTLTITPDTVVYTPEATGETAANGIFAVVALRIENAGDAPAAAAAPIEGGGWQWIAPDGQSVDGMDGNTANVTPTGFLGGGDIQPGTHQIGSAAFDLTDAQRGGTLIYVDGMGDAHRWTMPGEDTGPQTAKLTQALAG